MLQLNFSLISSLCDDHLRRCCPLLAASRTLAVSSFSPMGMCCLPCADVKHPDLAAVNQFLLFKPLLLYPLDCKMQALAKLRATALCQHHP